MVRRTTICVLAAVMALCVVPQGQSRAQSTAEKHAVIWLAEFQGKKAIEREAVSQKSLSALPGPHFSETSSAPVHLRPHSFDGRAPPRISIAG
jgi:hypothetical protein